MKTRFIVVYLFIVFSFISYSQEGIFNQIINESIENCLIYQKRLIKDSIIQSNTLSKVAFLWGNLSSNFQFSKSLKEEYGIAFFDDLDYSRKTLKEGIRCYQVLPIILEKDTLCVTISMVTLYKKKKDISIAVGDYYTIRYLYNCVLKEWALLDQIVRGI